MTFTAVGNETQSGNASTLTIGSGVSYSTGDLVVVYINLNGTHTITPDESGWTSFDETVLSETARIGVYHRIIGASDPSSFGFTFGSSDNHRGLLYAFSSATDAEVDSALNTVRNGTTSTDMVVSAIDTAVISDDAVSLVFCGKDNRADLTSQDFSSADNSYTGVDGATGDQEAAGAYRIYETGTTFSGDVTITDAGNSADDNPYSAHISFKESVAGSSLLFKPQPLRTHITR